MARRRLIPCVITCLCLAAAACAGSRGDGGEPASPPETNPPMSTATPDPEARRLLGEAEQAAGTLQRYAFSLNLTQRLDPVSGAGDEAAEVAATESEGRVEVRPRRVDQTVRVAFEGEWLAEYRTILEPEGAYVYEIGLDEWARVPKEEAAEMMDTLSDFQVDLPEAVRQVAALGPATAGQNEDGITVRYEGSGEEAHRFATRLLESTFAWSQQEERTRESLKVRHLAAELALDPDRLWPVAFRVEMEAELTMGDPEGSCVLTQTFTGAYSEHNEAAAVEVPAEAKEAPWLDPLFGNP